MNYNAALIQLPLVKEHSGEHLTTPAAVSELCRDMADCAQETFHCLLLNTKNRLINRILVSLGIADASLVHPREVFRAAIEANSSAIILAHNHPSGDPTPSAADLKISRQLIEVGTVIDIKVLDHVIIGRDPEFISLRESGLVQFR